MFDQVKAINKTKPPGFSVAELLISLGFITTVVLTVVGLTTTLHKTGQESTDRINAAMVGDSVLQQVVAYAQKNDHDNFWDNDHVSYDPGIAALPNPVIFDKTEYDWVISATTVQEGAIDLGSVTGLTRNRVKKVDITIHWWNSDTEKSYGYGKLAFSSSRLISEVNQ
jgi:hypothetical protein